MAEMQSIVTDLDHVSTPLLQQRMLHDLANLNAPSETKDHSALMAMLKPLKAVQRWANTYGVWLGLRDDVYLEWCKKNDDDAPGGDDGATLTARSSDDEDDEGDEEGGGGGGGGAKKGDKKKGGKKGGKEAAVKQPTPKAVERVLDQLIECEATIETIRELGEQTIDMKTLEDLATDALQMGGGAGLRRYGKAQKVLVRKKKFLGGYRWLEAEVKGPGDSSGKHKLKISGSWGSSVQLHPWNHAPLELPVSVFEKQLEEYIASLQDAHESYVDPLLGPSERLEVLQTPEDDREDEGNAEPGRHAASLRIQVMLTTDEETAKQKEEEAMRKEEEARAEKEQKEAEKQERREEMERRKKMKAKQRLGEAKMRERQRQAEEKALKKKQAVMAKEERAEAKKKERAKKAKQRAKKKKLKPLTEASSIVDDDTLAQWLNSAHAARLKGAAQSVPFYVPEDGHRTYLQIARDEKKAEEATAFKIRTLGELAATPPAFGELSADQVAQQVERFVGAYEAAHAAEDASGWIGLWALESGLRWHLPFGHPSIDGMDRIRATAIKTLPKVARLEVEGVFYAQDVRLVNNGSRCLHVALLCSVTTHGDGDQDPGETVKRLDLCALMPGSGLFPSLGLKELTCFMGKPPPTEERFENMEAQMARFNDKYARALAECDRDYGAGFKALFSEATEKVSVERNGKKSLEDASLVRWYRTYGDEPFVGVEGEDGVEAHVEMRQGLENVTAAQVYYSAVGTHAVLHYATRTVLAPGRASSAMSSSGTDADDAVSPGAVALVEGVHDERVEFLSLFTFDEPEKVVVEKKAAGRGKKEEEEVVVVPKKLKGAEDPGYWGFSDTRVVLEGNKDEEDKAPDPAVEKIAGRAGACCLVTAGPAGGKTLFCSQLIMRTLDLVMQGRSELVPILIKGQRLHTYLKDPANDAKFRQAWNWVDAYLQVEHAQAPVTYLTLRQAMMARRGLLILDGLDEGGDERERIETHVAEVLAPQGHVLVVTSRFDPTIEARFSGFHRLRLMPLSFEDQSKYIRQRIGDDEGGQLDTDKFELQRYLTNVVPSEPGTQTRITANPLLLSMMITLFQSPEADAGGGGLGAADGGAGTGGGGTGGGGGGGDDDDDDEILPSGRLPATMTGVYEAATKRMIDTAEYRLPNPESTPIKTLPPSEHDELKVVLSDLIFGVCFQAHNAKTRAIDAAVFDKAAFELMKEELKVDAQVQDKYTNLIQEREAHREQLVADYRVQLDLLKNEQQHTLDLEEVAQEVQAARERMAESAERTEAWVQRVMDAVEILNKTVLDEATPLFTLLRSDPDAMAIESAHLTFQEYFTARAICDGQRVATPPWKWTRWWDTVLDFGEEIGEGFRRGLYLASRVSTTREKVEIEEGVVSDTTVLKTDEDGEALLSLNLAKDRIGGDRETSVRAVGLMMREATTVYLVGNELSGDEVELLFPRDSKKATCPKLKYLDLHRNQIGLPDAHSGLVVGMERLSEAVRVGRLAALQGIDLHGNQIDTEGTRLLSSALSKGRCPSLKVLVLDRFEVFDQEARFYDAFGKGLNDDELNIIGALVQNGAMPLCVEFQLLGNSFGRKEIGEFVQILERREVAKLGGGDDALGDVAFSLVGDKLKGAHAAFTGFELKDEDVELIAQTLAHGGAYEHLKELDLSHNALSDNAAKWLAERIGQPRLLNRVWYPDPSRPAEGCRHLANLRGLNLSHTSIGHDGLNEIFKVMERGCLEDVQLLSLMRNNLTDDTVNRLAELAVEHGKLRGLRTLYFGHNKVSKDAFNRLAEALRARDKDESTGEYIWRHLPSMKEIYYTDRLKGGAGGFSEELQEACGWRSIVYQSKDKRR